MSITDNENVNSELQTDELTALSSIYANDMSEFNNNSKSFSITIRSSQPIVGKDVLLCVTLPPLYPTDCPPVFELLAPWLHGETRRLLEERLVDICQELNGSPVVFAWVEAVRQFVDETAEVHSSSCKISEKTTKWQENAESLATAAASVESGIAIAAKFIHGKPIEDRKSVFQAHLLAPVLSASEARNALACLLATERKIASATHNIWAYRISRPAGTAASATVGFVTDCDDDGESQAGGRLLRLLELADCRDCLVVVSRWYGGTLLGPDRFKHINNAARLLLEHCGIVRRRGV